MATTQQSVEFDKTLHDLNVALDILTDTLRAVDGCEYPRLLAREIQAPRRNARRAAGEPVAGCRQDQADGQGA
jgi:hypothetical protein